MTIKTHAELEAKIKKEFGLEFDRVGVLWIGEIMIISGHEEYAIITIINEQIKINNDAKAYQIIKAAYELEQAKNKLNELLEEV